METKNQERKELTMIIEDAKARIKLDEHNLEETKNFILDAIKKYGLSLDASVSEGSYISDPDFSFVGKDAEPLKNALYELGRELDFFSNSNLFYCCEKRDEAEKLLNNLEKNLE